MTNVRAPDPAPPVEGSLSVCVGPMFSGKTKYLVETHRRISLDFPSKQIVVVNFIGDDRYNNTAQVLTSHNSDKLPCLAAATLTEVMDDMSHGDVVLINEAQFFPDLVPCVLNLVNVFGKEVHVAGLDGDFRHEPFGTIASLVPQCDVFVKLRADCSQCGRSNRAIYSHRLTAETEQIVIGNQYTPICRRCFLLQDIQSATAAFALL